MKPNKRTQTTMTDRLNWMKGWIRLRQYDIGSKRNDFLYLYFCTMKALYSHELSVKLLHDMNDKLAKPLAEGSLKSIARKPLRPFTNATIIEKLGITQQEVDTLRIGHYMKEAEERVFRVLAKDNLKKEVLQMADNGHTAKEIIAAYPDLKLRTVQRWMQKHRQQRELSEKEERRLQAEVIRLYQQNMYPGQIARRTKCSIDTVRRILNLDAAPLFAKQEILKDKDELPKFISPEAERCFSLYKQEVSLSALDERNIAMAALKTSTENIALFGAAGTGKTVLIKDFLASLPPEERAATLVVAPTGRAAAHLNAQTIHSAFHLDLNVQPNDELTAVPRKLYKIRRLIIDEISMTRIDLFSRVMKTIQYIERKKHKSIQVIVVGDYGQIQPVATPADLELLNEYYPNAKGVYAFHSEEWEQLRFRKIVLKHIHRQDEPEFIEKLNEIKYGRLDAVHWFNENACPFANIHPIYICATNSQVDHYNAEALQDFDPDELVEFKAAVTGGTPKEELPCPDRLLLTEGMRVMTICNDKQYKNGSIGTITKILQRSIRVKLDDGSSVTIRPKRFKLMGGVTYEQLPIVLAYAITANKSQGCTFNEVTIVPGFFAPGQLYTALSRCRSIDRLNIVGELTASDLKVDVDALMMTVDEE